MKRVARVVPSALRMRWAMCWRGDAPRGYSVGPPKSAIVPPGQCQFGEDWSTCELLSKQSVSHDTRVFTFSTPDRAKPLNLSTCACILAKGPVDDDGNAVVRPYTPVSTNAMVGQFELMVKVYAQGKMTQYLDSLKLGETVDFKHIPFNVKRQYPFGKARLGIIAGGTGITPMIQALHAVLGTEGDTTTVSLLYGNRKATDILAKKTLEDWSMQFPDRLAVTHVLSAEPEGSAWKGERGYIRRELVEAHLPSPADDCLIFVCGPPPMYNALCGPRDKAELTGLLAEMGYDAEQVYKF